MTPEEIKALVPEHASLIDCAFDPVWRMEGNKPETKKVLTALAQARKELADQKDIVDAAVEWQSYWSDNTHFDKDGIKRRQGYLYDRVRRYREILKKQESRNETNR